MAECSAKARRKRRSSSRKPGGAPVHLEEDAEEVGGQRDAREVAGAEARRDGAREDAAAVEVDEENAAVGREQDVLVAEVQVDEAGVVEAAAGGGDALQEGDEGGAGAARAVQRREAGGEGDESGLVARREEPRAAVRGDAGEGLGRGAGEALVDAAGGEVRALRLGEAAREAVREGAEGGGGRKALHDRVGPREREADGEVAAALQDDGAVRKAVGVERGEGALEVLFAHAGMRCGAGGGGETSIVRSSGPGPGAMRTRTTSGGRRPAARSGHSTAIGSPASR